MSSMGVLRGEALKQATDMQKNHALYCAKFLKIETKAGKLIPFRFNGPQDKFEAALAEAEEKGKKLWVIILKSRQMGISTYVQSRIFKRTATRSNQNGRVVAHIEDSSTLLFRMSQRFYDHLPEVVTFKDGSVFKPKPTQKYSNRKELVFGDLNSEIRHFTAGNIDAARSSTIHALHCSEVAFWANAKENMKALLGALTDNSFAVIESTANGVGGWFYDFWKLAESGEISWIPIFIAWWEAEEYQTPLEEGEAKAFAASLTKEERALKAAYNLTLEQLKWRRLTIQDRCFGDVDTFKQEFPSNAEEAFLVSGRPYFARNVLNEALEMVSPGVRGDLAFVPGTYKETEEGQVKVNRDTRVKFVPNEEGYLELWGFPGAKGSYAVGADVAEGLEKGDYSAAVVTDRDSGQQVAEWHGHMDPDLYGAELVKLGLYFNRAWVAPEANNHGLTVIKAMVRMGYTRIYPRQHGFDKDDVKATDRLGWLTTSVTRPLMLDGLATALREGAFIVSSKALLGELRTFVKSATGRPEAQQGAHDDLVVAASISLQVHIHCPLSRPVPKEDRERQAKRRRQLSKPVVSKTTGY